jgi:molybdopterin converting factor small subunit
MLIHAVGDARHVWVDASTLSELIRNLQNQFPLLRPLVWDDQLQLRKHIMIFLNDQSLHWLDDPDPALKEGDTLSIVQAVSGG